MGQLYSRETSLTSQYLPTTSKSRSQEKAPEPKYQRSSLVQIDPAKAHLKQFYLAVCTDLGPDLKPSEAEHDFAINDFLAFNDDIAKIEIARICVEKLPYENEYVEPDR